jgi:2-succinyl-6-hydroxy-2,4-cyclohexadiene-1-carboxylate synthase
MPHLHTEVDNAGATPRTVLVHGFTQTRRSWRDLPARLVLAGHEVVRLDLPGHGGSGDVVADLPRSGALVVDAGAAATYLGYSLGARVALHSALARPDAVQRLVLVSGTAGLRDADARAARRAEDEERATRIETIGVDAFLDEWLALPLFAGLTTETAGVAARRENTAAGLASSLRRCGAGTQEPLWDRLPELAMPVLCVAGADDAKFAAIATELAGAIPNADLTIVARAGHAPHLQQPDEFWDAVGAWLDRTATR